MTYYVIDAARRDAKGYLTHVCIGEVDAEKYKYVYQAEVQPLEFVLSKLHRADTVMLLTPQRSPGVMLNLAVEAQTGREYVTEANADEHPGGSLKDLPTC